ncbi:MAG: HSP20 family protein [Parvicellaceae bacterium]|jgi:HSP20 family protein
MSVLTRRKNGIRHPFRSMVSDLFDNDRFFNEPILDFSLPAVNVKETDESFEIEVAAPGMKKDDFNVNIENGILKISSEKEEESEEVDENYTRKEFSYSSFGRSFTLPDSINSEKINAKYDAGVLRIELAKNEEAKRRLSKSIDIK